MPAPDSKQATTWPLPKLDAVEIVYTSEDRFGDADADPHIRCVQHFAGAVTGILFEDGSTYETRVPLGTVDVARVELYEDVLAEVLDAHSAEWVNYFGVVEDLLEAHDDDWITRDLVILDRVEVVPEARGHGLGLHAAARALRTWAGDESLVVATAWPPGGEGASGRKAGEALARYWQRLGLKRAEGISPPILYGHTGMRRPYDTLVELSEWESPDHA